MSQEKTWTVSEIREMLNDMMNTDPNDDDWIISTFHVRRYFTDHGIDMIGQRVETVVYSDQKP